MTDLLRRKFFRAPRRRQGAAVSRTRTVTIAGRDVTTRGLHQSYWSDFYYNAMTIGWGAFLAYAAAIFVLVNALFAVAYLVGAHPVADVGPGDPLQLFFFSIETLATVGYGDMHPQTMFGHAVASVEMFVGLFMSALLTGLIFARFSRPRARFVFANLVTIGPHNGQPTLIMRVANARQNMIGNATAKLWVIRKRTNPEGVSYRGFEQLSLEKSENPIFVLSWSLFHTIDAASPLAGLTVDDMRDVDMQIMLAVTGQDEMTTQQVHGRQSYAPEQVRWNHRYVDILGEDADGAPVIDYAYFHDVTEIAPSRPDQLASASMAS